MSDYIPISRVFISYKPSSAEFAKRTYSGIILGECKDLHYVRNTLDDRSSYVINEDDTRVADKIFNGTPVVAPLTSELVIPFADYPNFKSGHTPDYDSVTLYANKSRLLAMYRDTSSIGGAAPVTLIPLSGDTAVLYKAKVLGEEAAQLATTEFTVGAGVDSYVISSTSNLKKSKVLPGSYGIIFTLTDSVGPTTYDILISDKSPITGKLTPEILKAYFYDSAASLWKPIADIATPPLLSISKYWVSPYASGSGFSVSINVISTCSIADTRVGYFPLDDENLLRRESEHHVTKGLKGGDVLGINASGKLAAITIAPPTSIGAFVELDKDSSYGDIDRVEYLVAQRTDLLSDNHELISRTLILDSRAFSQGTVKSVDDSTGVILFTEQNLFGFEAGDTNGVIPIEQFSLVYLEGAYDNREIPKVVTPAGSANEFDVTVADQTLVISNEIVRDLPGGLSDVLFEGWDGSYDGVIYSAALSLAYMAENHDPRLFQQVTLIKNRDEAEAIVGHDDINNPLGFAYYRTYEISQKAMYVMIMDTSSNSSIVEALGILSTYQDILHVYLLVGDYVGAFDSWVAEECTPDKSRFRLGFNPTKINEVKTLYNNEIINGDLTVDAVTHHYTLAINSSVNTIRLSDILVPGALVELKLSGVTDPVVYTVGDSSGITLNTVVFIETSATIPPVKTAVEMDATKKMNSAEIATSMYDAQQSDNTYFMKILSGSIDYTYKNVYTDEEMPTQLDVMFNGIMAFVSHTFKSMWKVLSLEGNF